MPRSKEGVVRNKVDSANVDGAANLVLNQGWSIRQAAMEMAISKSTLARHLKLHRTAGNDDFHHSAKNDVRRVFSSEEEEALKCYLKEASLMHYGLTRKQFRSLALDFAQVNSKNYPASWDRDGMAGKNFYYEFMRRHGNDLSLRKPQATSLARSTSFNRHNVSTFFSKLKEVQEREGFTPDRIYNVDETGMSTVHNPSNVIATKGAKQVGHMTSGERGVNVTVISSVNAIGNSVPPAFVFPRVHYKDNMLKGAPPGSIGFAHISGWSNSEIFVSYLQHFIKHSKPSLENKVLLILDNHKSHVSIECLKLAKDSGIVLLTFPPHTSHKLQPLDRSVFGPLKKYYNTTCGEWLLSNGGRPMTIYDVSECVGRAYPLAFTPQNIQAGFRVSGIFPLNENIFTDDEFLSCSVTERPQPEPRSATPEPGTSVQISQSPNRPQSVSLELTRETFVSPQQIRPHPKAIKRQQRRGGPKPGRCRILTDTPEKQEIENEMFKKIAQASKQTTKRKVFAEKEESSSSSDEDMSLPSSGDSLDDVDFAEKAPNDNLEEVNDVNVGDFALARLQGKKTQHFYVVEVLKRESDVLEVRYLKRTKHLTGKKFVYSSEQTYELPLEDIIKKLPPPIPVGATARQGNFLLFSVDFSNYNVE